MKTEMVDTWICEECPFKEECSAKSWARAYCKSQTSEQHCRKILWYHLSSSGLHEKQTREDVYQACMNWPIALETKPKWGNPDERFDGCSHDIIEPDDEKGHEAALEELRVAKRKMGDDEPGGVRTPCPPSPRPPRRSRRDAGHGLSPHPLPFPTHAPTHSSFPGECPGPRLGLAGHVLDLPRILL